jgi:hypothetical protein
MDVKARFALAGGVATGLALIILDRIVSREKQLIALEQEMPVPAARVVDLIMQVEHEHELIPLISSVEVHEKTNTDVHYTIRAAGGIPGTVKYIKTRDETLPAVYWHSMKGTMGFHHEGGIHFTESDGRSDAYLWSAHWMTIPLLGRVIAPMLTPAIRSGLEVWLKRIAEVLKARVQRTTHP